MRWIAAILGTLAVVAGGLVAFDYFAPYEAVRLGLDLERGRAGLQARNASIEGLDWEYLDGGAGEPLLLIHGFGADKDNFTRVAGLLTPQYRVVIPDLPGYGGSSKPADADYGILAQVERLRGFARRLELGKVHLGGSSMGGYIAAAWAAKYPDEVATLWLLAPAATRVAVGESELGRIYRDTGANPLLAQNAEEHARVRAFVMSRPPFLPYSVKHVLAERAAANYPLHLKIFTELAKGPTLETWAPRIDTPALIVWGDQDRALSPKGAEATRALMPNGRVIMMAGVGHLPMLEDVARSAQDYLAFRAALAAR